MSNERVDHVRQVLTLLHNPGLTLTQEKCEVFTNCTNCIDYLRHFIRPGLLEVSIRMIDAIRRLERPAPMTEVRSFQGMCNVFYHFFPKLAFVVASLNRKLRKGRLQISDRLNDDEITCLETLKAKLVEPPLSAFPLPQGDYTLVTDACDKQNGHVFVTEASKWKKLTNLILVSLVIRH